MEHPIFSEAQCSFCDKPAGRVPLHDLSTFGLDERVRKCALKSEYKALLAKYHTQCLVSLYNKARDAKSSEETNTDRANHGIALAELVCYIDETRADSEVAPLFKMTDLTNLDSNRFQQLGTNITGRVHSTRLKNRILGYFPDLEAHKQGRELVLVFNKDIGQALKKVCG